MALLTLDHDEAELALLALHYLADQAKIAPVNGVNDMVARRCCFHVEQKVRAVIEHIEQWQEDEGNGDG